MQPAKSPDAAACYVCPAAGCFRIKPSPVHRLLGCVLCMIPVLLSGCSLFSTPGLKMPTLPGLTSPPIPTQAEVQANYVPVGSTASLPSATFNQEVYQSVRNAKANNSIVLQVLDDDTPIRILPLPSAEGSASDPAVASPGGGRSVFVSTLLNQTGVMRKLGKAQAALYRPSPENYEGIRMDVLFSAHSTEQVRPESDYALRPGDRLVIRKDDRMGMSSFIDMALGR